MYDINLQQLIYFFTAAEYSNFSKAAKNMYIAQPALSKWIMKLEASLGIKLFERVHHGVRLTEAGNHLYHSLKPIVEEISRTLNYAQATWGGDHKNLSVCYMMLLATDNIILEKIHHYKEQFPYNAIKLDALEPDAIRQAFCNRVYDICIAPTFIFTGISDIYTRLIKKQPVYINLALSHPLASREKVTVADLKNETFCLDLYSEGDEVTNQHVYELCRKHGFVPEKVEYAKNSYEREMAILLGCVWIGGSVSKPDSIRSYEIKGEEERVSISMAWYTNNVSEEILNFIRLFPDLS